MKNKEIQEKRMRNYFIQAAKEILKGEGIQAISVRNIADRAGYSYATLYNYFKDINELIFVCVNDFQEECKIFVRERTSEKTEGKEKLKASVFFYISYFLEYPGIFDLFYLAKPSGVGINSSTLKVIGSSLDDVCDENWKYCLKHHLFQANEAVNIKSQLRYTVIGMLLLYMNRRIPNDYPAFIQQVNGQINEILI